MSMQMDGDLPRTGVNGERIADRPPRPIMVGLVLLGISALGLPLTLGAIRRMRRLGRLAAEMG
jgi:hypothetical protein